MSERGKKEDACVCMSEKSGSKWHWERETGGRGMSDCVCVFVHAGLWRIGQMKTTVKFAVR